MPVLRSTVRIDAPLPAVAAALRDVGVLRDPGRAGPRSENARPLGDGDEVDVQVRLAPGIRLALRLRAGPVTLDRLRCTLVAEPGARPVPVEHAALRWVGAAELADLDWLDADRVVLPDLELALRAG